jgi:hypothetical protein
MPRSDPQQSPPRRFVVPSEPKGLLSKNVVILNEVKDLLFVDGGTAAAFC